MTFLQVLDVADPPPLGKCKDTKVYIADVTGFALIVYDALNGISWKITNKLVTDWQKSDTIIVILFYSFFLIQIMGQPHLPINLLT